MTISGTILRGSSPTLTEQVTLQYANGQFAGGLPSVRYTYNGATDTTPPVFSNVPASATIEANTTGGAVYAGYDEASEFPIATDAVDGNRTVTASHPLGTVFPLTAPGPTSTIVNFSASDTSGNTANASFTVTVQDTTPPSVIVPADITVEATSSAGAVVNFAGSATDIADAAPAITYSRNPGTTFPLGTTTVTVTATDATGNSSNATFNVTVEDTTAPVITVPADITAEATSASGAIINYSAPTATDAVGVTSLTSSPASGSTFSIGTTTVTVTAQDAAGNTSQKTFTVTVQDTTPPTITAPADITAEATSSAGAIGTFTPTATDAVGVTSLTSTPTSGSTFPLGDTTVTITALDGAGNSSQATFQVKVQDTTPPALTLPANIVTNTDPGQATAVVSFTPTASDAVGVTSLTSSPASGSAFPIGATTVSVIATDAAGNSSSGTFTVTVNDNEAPVITVPADITVNTDPGQPTAVVNFNPTATDNDGVASLTASPASGSAFPIGTTAVTVTATDNSGNTSQKSFNVTVNDNEAPVITVPADITVNTDPGQPTAVVNFNPTATDNDGVASLTASPASGSAFPIGTTAVTVTATDNSGNQASATFNVTVNDNEAPVIAVPADIVTNTDPGQPTAVVTFTPTATDNVGVASLTSSPASGSVFPIGATTVTVTATDTAGNSASATFTVTVQDDEPPVIVGLSSNISVDVNYPDTSAVITYTPPTVTDNASGATIVLTAGLASGSAFPLGTTVVTYTATDASGNSVSESFNVNVNQIPPGEVTIAVVSDVTDGTFSFSSTEPQLNFNVTTSGGTGQSTPVLIKPGTYVVTLTPPSGFGLTAIACSDADSATSISGKTATIVLASAESVTCTFTSANSRTKTVEVISRFMSRRADLLLSNGPDGNRQIDRLIEAGSGNGGGASEQAGFQSSNASRLGATTGPSRLGDNSPALGGSALTSRANTGTAMSSRTRTFEERLAEISGAGDAPPEAAPGLSPVSATGSNEGATRLSFATSLSQIAKFNDERTARKAQLDSEAMGLGAVSLPSHKRRFMPFDIWMEGHYFSFADDRDNTDSDGHFGVVYLGADYVVNPSFLIGALIQYDSMKEASTLDAYRIEGHGWMAGPYATLRLSENVFLQARAAWGKSDNDVSPFLTYTDNFDSTRWLVSSTLKGRWQHGPWQLRPSATIAFIEDRSEAYVDSLGVTIPGVKVSLGQFKAGPEVSYRYESADGTVLEPHFALEAVWNFASSDQVADFGGTLSGPEELRGRVELGVTAKFPSGIALDLSGSYDGIGSDDFHAIGGKAVVRIPLN